MQLKIYTELSIVSPLHPQIPNHRLKIQLVLNLKKKKSRYRWTRSVQAWVILGPIALCNRILVILPIVACMSSLSHMWIMNNPIFLSNLWELHAFLTNLILTYLSTQLLHFIVSILMLPFCWTCFPLSLDDILKLPFWLCLSKAFLVNAEFTCNPPVISLELNDSL